MCKATSTNRERSGRFVRGSVRALDAAQRRRNSPIAFDLTVQNSIGASGLAQWYQGRFTNLQSFAASKGKEWSDFDTQLEFFKHEWSSWPGHEDFEKMTDVAEATEWFDTHYEVSGGSTLDTRIKYANEFLKKFK